jgi:hypothetical protein
MAAIKSEPALTPNVGPFGRIPLSVLAQIAGCFDEIDWYGVLPQVARGFVSAAEGELSARKIVNGWGRCYVSPQRWWMAGGCRHVLLSPEVRWPPVSFSRMRQAQFVQLVRSLEPRQCERLRVLDLDIPRVAEARDHVLELEDLRRLSRACPNVQTLIANNLKSTELSAMLSVKSELSHSEMTQFPSSLTRLEFGAGSDVSVALVLDQMVSLKSVRICSERVQAHQLAWEFSGHRSLVDTLKCSCFRASPAMHNISTLSSITSLDVVGSRFECWDGFAMMAAMPHLRELSWGRMEWPKQFDWNNQALKDLWESDYRSELVAVRTLAEKAVGLQRLHFVTWGGGLDVVLPYCAQMHSLRHVTVDDSEITDAGLKALGQCSQLTQLGFDWLDDIMRSMVKRGLMVTDQGLMALSSCPQLTELTLSGGCFTADGISKFATTSRSLKFLDLRRTLLDYNRLTIPDHKRINILGCRYVQLGAVLTAFEKEHPNRMELFLRLPQIERQGICRYRWPRSIQILPGLPGLKERYGEARLKELAFQGDSSIPGDYYLDDYVKIYAISQYLLGRLKRI